MTTPVRNVLFIMCDQLRWDAISCSGHSVIDTPNIDALAARGVRFDRAYVQGTTCGSSRASWYTGRYTQSHGVRYNRVPMELGQRTLGDHLAPLGIDAQLLGKTHMIGDLAGMGRLGLEPDDQKHTVLRECGFLPVERDDGLWPEGEGRDFSHVPYNKFLASHGFGGHNPWHSAANSVLDDDGNLVSGWLLRSSGWPAIVPDELSETAYFVDRAIEHLAAQGDERWCLHLSFIKPHWPYVVSDPWHKLVSVNDLPTPHRSETELETDHPVMRAFHASRIGRTLSRDDVRRVVWPAYLGLVAQIDHHLGRLFAELDRTGRTDDTMIVFTSDHGDYLGDHWQGDKDWFHEESVRVPFIVVDPRPEADATRGTGTDQLVEAIDLVPTIVESMGGDVAATQPWTEGRSLIPMLHETPSGGLPDRDQGGDSNKGVEYAMSESDYGFLEMVNHLPQPLGSERGLRGYMLRTDRWKYIVSEVGRDLLYDLENDPDEFVDLGADPAHESLRSEFRDAMFQWFRARHHDSTLDEAVARDWQTPGLTAADGVLIGYWDEDDQARGLAGDLF